MRSPKRVVWLVGAWVAATVATAAVALAVVGLAGDQVADVAVHPLSPQEVEALGIQAPVSSVMASSTSPVPTTSATAGTATTTASDASSTTTALPAPTTVTTAPSASTTTTVASGTTSPQSAQIDSRQITGGTVVVRWTPSSVELVSASPTDGFSVDVEKRGPDKVELEFEGDGVKSKYAAEISDGELVVQTSVEQDD